MTCLRMFLRSLGLRAIASNRTRDRLKTVMEQDWDQTVRRRAREAIERMRELKPRFVGRCLI